jgi:TIR domain
MPTAIEIFCCYAREDQDLMKNLRKHLKPLERRNLIRVWSDTDIDAGDTWEEEIKKHLDTAHIILLLISPDFMASDYCYSTEMEQAMQRHAQKEARVIPIILRPTAWKGAPFDKLQVLPSNAKPVTDRRSWQDADEALNDVIQHIDPIVIELLLPLFIEKPRNL